MDWPADRLDPEAYPGPGVDLPVFYGDLDTNHHVNNVALGRYFEMGRYELHHRIGLGRRARAHGGSLVVARVAIDYLAEVLFGVGPLHVRTRLAALGRTSLTEHQAAWQQGRCVALAEIVAVYRHDGAAAPWPDDIRAAVDAMNA
jgi:acyl-CoA thioester hydrolase